HPTRLRRKHDLGNCEIRWLTQTVGAGNLDPSRVNSISAAISSFLERHTDALVLLDGLEYILENNQITKVIGMLEGISQRVIAYGACMICAVTEEALDARTLSLLSRVLEKPPQSTGDVMARKLDEF
ncbi:MAG: DUF835 domain-containing protein, partial [Methanomassiliicoccales archaeon]